MGVRDDEYDYLFKGKILIAIKLNERKKYYFALCTLQFPSKVLTILSAKRANNGFIEIVIRKKRELFFLLLITPLLSVHCLEK